MNKLEAFKAYDIRGEWGRDLDSALVYKIGYFLPQVLHAGNMLVGWDDRLSSNEAQQALTRGINDAGCDVTLAGRSTTPMIYWGTGKFGFDASIMITASHNPKNHNGLKVSGKGVLPVGYDNGLKTVEQLILSDAAIKPGRRGGSASMDLQRHYLEFLSAYTSDFGNLKIAIDGSNGMAGLFTRQLFGKDPIYLNNEPDGTFPGHDPNPLNPKNQDQIKQAVLQNHCDIGLIFDGDADRVMFIDEKGHFISPDLVIALLGHYFFEERKQTGTVVQDIRTSKSVAEYLAKKFDAKVETWRVGRAYGATKLKELDGVYGGELAGHYYFRDFYYSDSGLLAALFVLQIVSKFKSAGTCLSDAIKNISAYANTGEVNFKVEKKQWVMDEVKRYFDEHEPPLKFYDFDGYRLEFEDWWFNIRPSNTEPYLRFLAEAKSRELLDEKTRLIYDIVEKYA